MIQRITRLVWAVGSSPACCQSVPALRVSFTAPWVIWSKLVKALGSTPERAARSLFHSSMEPLTPTAKGMM